MFERLVCLLIGYVLGNVLTADLVSRHVAHRSAFELGVGNPGMANIGHELGHKAAAATLTGDIGKVIVATLIAQALFPALGGVAIGWAGLGATLGHNYPAWHGFKGGKGVATTSAAIVLMTPVFGIVALLVGLVMSIASGYLCIGAIAITVSYASLMLIFGSFEYTILSAIFLALMILAHGSAVAGIKDGTTPRAGIANAFRSLVGPDAHTRHRSAERMRVSPRAQLKGQESSSAGGSGFGSGYGSGFGSAGGSGFGSSYGSSSAGRETPVLLDATVSMPSVSATSSHESAGHVPADSHAAARAMTTYAAAGNAPATTDVLDAAHAPAPAEEIRRSSARIVQENTNPTASAARSKHVLKRWTNFTADDLLRMGHVVEDGARKVKGSAQSAGKGIFRAGYGVVHGLSQTPHSHKNSQERMRSLERKRSAAIAQESSTHDRRSSQHPRRQNR
jgi:glycerol-3-phosphate acyltransferase PlsY